MTEDAGGRYYAAVLASGLSVLGWVGATLGAGYTVYAFLFEPTVGPFPLLTAVSLLAGIVFARVEKRLYRVDRGRY